MKPPNLNCSYPVTCFTYSLYQAYPQCIPYFVLQYSVIPTQWSVSQDPTSIKCGIMSMIKCDTMLITVFPKQNMV